jgi:hypothetical protein
LYSEWEIPVPVDVTAKERKTFASYLSSLSMKQKRVSKKREKRKM